jgi:hypothetical protein
MGKIEQKVAKKAKGEAGIQENASVFLYSYFACFATFCSILFPRACVASDVSWMGML